MTTQTLKTLFSICFGKSPSAVPLTLTSLLNQILSICNNLLQLLLVEAIHKRSSSHSILKLNISRSKFYSLKIKFKNLDFLSYIFNVSENTEIIHLMKMIWLFSFIISSFKSASGPPNDPGGSKEDIFKIKEMIHRIFSVKSEYRACS